MIGPDLGTADVYVTALFVMGVDGLEWIEGRDGYDGYVITHDDTTHWTAGFPVDSGRAGPGRRARLTPTAPQPLPLGRRRDDRRRNARRLHV